MKLETENLKFNFSTNFKKVFEYKDMCFETGFNFGIYGSNGSGKSTFLKCLASLYKVNSGKIFLNGKDVYQNLKEYRPKVTFIEGGQQGLYPRLNPIENLQFFSGLRDNMLTKSQAAEVLSFWGLKTSDFTKQISNYSTGMKQRVHLSRLNIENSFIRLLDEPTSGLDDDGVEILINYLNNTKKSNAITIVVSHDMAFLKSCCDCVCDFNKEILL